MIRTLAVNCASMLDCSKDGGNTAAGTASNEMVMGAAQAPCEFSQFVSQQNHSDLSLKALHDALKRFSQKKRIFHAQKMSKSAKAKVDDMVATASYQLREHKNHKIHAAMEALVYGAEKVSSTKHRQFQLRLNRARQTAMTWSDADCQKPIERLERGIHQVIPAKHNLFNK